MSQMHDAASKSASIARRGLLFHLAQRWRMILFSWFAVSVVSLVAVFQLVEPTFEASATLEVKPPRRAPLSILDAVTGENASPASMNSEVDSILSDRVLDEALADPGASEPPFTKHATDPNPAVRQSLTVRMVPGTFKIQITLASHNKDEAAAIVNAVADAYLRQRAMSTADERALYRRKLTSRVDDLRERLKEMQSKRIRILDQDIPTIDRSVSATELTADNGDGSESRTSYKSLNGDQYRKLSERLLQTDLDLVEATAALTARTSESIDFQWDEHGRRTQDLRARIVGEFLRDTYVKDLVKRIRNAADALEQMKENSPKDADAVRSSEEKLKALQEKYAGCWATQAEEIHDRLCAEAETVVNQAIGGIKARIAGLNATRKTLLTILFGWDDERVKSNQRAAQAAFLSQELEALGRIYGQTLEKLEEFEFMEGLSPLEDVSLVDHARVPMYPTKNLRPKLLTVLPVAAFFLVLALFMAWECVRKRKQNEEVTSLPRNPV